MKGNLIYIRRAAPVIAGILLLVLTGCNGALLPMGSEITSYEIIRVLGIDAAGNDEIEVTVIAERAKPSPGEEGGGMAYEVISARADTAFEAVAKLRAQTDKKQVFGYVDYIIFGEATAKENFTKYADFPARNPEIRYSPKVFIARGGTAKELLEQTSSGDKYIGDSLDNLNRNVNERSDFSLMRNIELMNKLDSGESAAVIPAIRASAQSGGEMIDGELPDKKLTSAGYAVLRDFALAGFFDGSNARAYNMLTGSARTGAYSVKDYTGMYAGLDVVSGGLSVKAQWDGKTLRGVTYRVRANANIAEQRSLENLDTSRGQTELSKKLEEAVERELRGAVEKSKEYGIDCFGLAERLRMKHPYRWRAIEGSWREIYKNLEINVKVDAAVRRSYDIREPSGFTGGYNDR